MSFTINFSTINDVDITFNIGNGAKLDATSKILLDFGFQRVMLHCGLSGWVYRLFVGPDGGYIVLGTGSYDTGYVGGDKPLDIVKQVCPCCFNNELRRRIRNFIRRRRNLPMYKFLTSEDYIALAVICDYDGCSIDKEIDYYTYSVWPESYDPGLSHDD